MKLKFAVASVLAVASMSAFADNQTVTLNVGADNFFNTSNAVNGALYGGHDVITFNGLEAGFYNILVSISGQNLTFGANSNLNGTTGEIFGNKAKFFEVEVTDQGPFVLNLYGTALAGAKYSGEVTVTSAVPEPTTYGMLLGGLGIMGFLARRKSKQA
ncbi:FxDxF family PEP-CTERM protein [Pseudoduganella lutea]|uniref:PEP-CTERM sorting domain-containing protein n=1 Tax=Pseudoduganella lutea TaxID=321985 RepID=A0A4P6KUJ8_9BURK|nr:FxDxF family PEP-CTERM protein [Pseudoduganella lutea]QBE62497.1 PEP-CTERM sorting domain-containing protein [Pseudoduganella lutea]